MHLDSVQIGTPDLDDATAAYERLLGVTPAALPGGARRFQLARGAVELESGTAGVHSIAFATAVGETTPSASDSFNGIDVRIDPPAPGAPLPDAAAVPAIDHIVVHTTAPERAIALWCDRYGLRLALDREFPKRGLRLLFFRSGGITLEYACPLAASDESVPDRFYGISYRVPDLPRWRSRLVEAGADVSDIRTGMRPGTSVCSVRSGTAGVPTLLLALHDPA